MAAPAETEPGNTPRDVRRIVRAVVLAALAATPPAIATALTWRENAVACMLANTALCCLCFVAAGWAAGLVLRERPHVTATVVACAGVVVWFVALASTGEHRGVGEVVGLLGGSVYFALCAFVPTYLATLAAKGAAGRPVWVCVGSLALVGVFTWALSPVLRHNAGMKEFRATGFPRLESYASRELGVPLPASLKWTLTPAEPFTSLYSARAEWSVSKAPAGDCALSVTVLVPTESSIEADVREISLSFTPKTEGWPKSVGEAQRYLRAVRPTPPPFALTPDDSGNFDAKWEAGGHSYSITVGSNGNVWIDRKRPEDD